MSKPLENKLALVTGSSRGIGAAIAVRLAAEGASVIAEADFNVVVQHLVDTLNKFKVPDAEQRDLLGIIGTLKNDMVENK